MQERGAVSIAESIATVQEQIAAALHRAGRTDEVTIVAVTKQVPVERIAEAYRIGLRHFGENRVQEFEEKRRMLVLPSAIWHMIGNLQSNKAARAIELFDRIDSLDSVNLAQKLNAADGSKIPVLVRSISATTQQAQSRSAKSRRWWSRRGAAQSRSSGSDDNPSIP
jgi:uncharacterized pyridoxal phosphate-containing UPF0001 family protein